jgi:hypothetical protein
MAYSVIAFPEGIESSSLPSSGVSLLALSLGIEVDGLSELSSTSDNLSIISTNVQVSKYTKFINGQLTYTWYAHTSTTHPTTTAELDAFYDDNNSWVTFGGTGTHTDNVFWGSTNQSSILGITGNKPVYLPAESYSWKVDGYIYADETGLYTFAVDGDDACDIIVNGVAVAYYYGGHGFNSSRPASATGTIYLEAGNYYSISCRMEEVGGGDGIAVGWKKPSQGSLSVIPSTEFYTSLTGGVDTSKIAVDNWELVRTSEVNDSLLFTLGVNTHPSVYSVSEPGGVNAYITTPGEILEDSNTNYVMEETPSVFNTTIDYYAGVAGTITSSTGTTISPTYYTGVIAGLEFTTSTQEEYTSYIFNGDTLTNLSANEIFTVPGNRNLLYGSITADKVIEVTIINKRLESIYFDSFDIPSTYGLEVSGLTPGYEIPANTSVTVYITASLMDGDESVSGNIYFNFDVASIYWWVEVERSPTIIYTYQPNKNTYSESYSFKTNIFTTTTGKEKRTFVSNKPKREVKYSITSGSIRDSMFVQNTVYFGMYEAMYQPLWAFATKTTDSVVNSSLIPCDTYYGVFNVDDFIGIYLDEYTAILAKIVNVLDNYLVINKNVTVDNNSFILPLILGTPNTSMSRAYITGAGQNISMNLKEL